MIHLQIKKNDFIFEKFSIDLKNLIFCFYYEFCINCQRQRSDHCCSEYLLRGHTSIPILNKSNSNTDKPNIHALVGHNDRVNFLQYINGVLASAASYEIKLWNISEKKCIADCTGHNYKITALMQKDGYLISGDKIGEIRVWDLRGIKNWNKSINNKINAVKYFNNSDEKNDSKKIHEFINLPGNEFASLSNHNLYVWDLPNNNKNNTIKPSFTLNGVIFRSIHRK